MTQPAIHKCSCGNAGHTMRTDSRDFFVACFSVKCPVYGPVELTESEAIAAWNAEREKDATECPHCSGLGRVPFESQFGTYTCPNCLGTGKKGGDASCRENIAPVLSNPAPTSGPKAREFEPLFDQQSKDAIASLAGRLWKSASKGVSSDFAIIVGQLVTKVRDRISEATAQLQSDLAQAREDVASQITEVCRLNLEAAGLRDQLAEAKEDIERIVDGIELERKDRTKWTETYHQEISQQSTRIAELEKERDEIKAASAAFYEQSQYQHQKLSESAAQLATLREALQYAVISKDWLERVIKHNRAGIAAHQIFQAVERLQSEVTRLTAELDQFKAVWSDPVKLHLNLLRNPILSRSQIMHLAGVNEHELDEARKDSARLSLLEGSATPFTYGKSIRFHYGTEQTLRQGIDEHFEDATRGKG